MGLKSVLPPGVIAFGSKSNCNLDNCKVEWSIFEYRPSLPVNIILLALFALIGAAHVYLGIRWKTYGFMTGMLIGTLCLVIGYIGRIMLYYNPFNYKGFLVQIICLTIAPVFFTASIYITLTKAILFFGAEVSRFKPQLFTWVFLPADIICLVLQAAGGAISTQPDGTAGVDISMAGLILQVIILFFFILAFSDYMYRYVKSGRASGGFSWRLKAFFAGLSASILLILARCAFRVAELKDGYSGEMIKHEVPFIVLEGFVIVLAVSALFFGHPGLALKPENSMRRGPGDEKGSGDDLK